MASIPNPNELESKNTQIYCQLLLPKLIYEVSIYMVKEKLQSCFYNLSDFYLKNRLNNEEVKEQLKSKIIELLKDRGYHLAYVFNNTGLIICRNEDELNESVWKSNLSFNKI